MPSGARLDHSRRPSTPAFMLRALYPTFLRTRGPFPDLSASWTRHRLDGRRLAAFLRLTGLEAREALPVLYPHVSGFPLQMVILTHPSLPIPIWRVLQIRNHLLQHRPIAPDAVVDLETRVAGQRILDKGVELDLHTSLHCEGALAWESLNTFYYRGRFGEPGTPSALARSPEIGGEVVARWRTPAGGGLRFASLTGDYNGLHWWSPYARLLGFRRSFHHPQLVLGQALAHLGPARAAPAQRLDAWLKGPVYHGGEVSLRAAPEPDGAAFAVIADGEQRPALVGRWRALAAGGTLRDA